MPPKAHHLATYAPHARPSTVLPSYDLHKERSFCLDCNAVESQARSTPPQASAAAAERSSRPMEWQARGYGSL